MGQRTILAFDFGLRSIGVAIGQEVTATARPLCALKAQQGQPHWSEVEKLFRDWQPDLVVVGLPLNMDGTEQPLTQQARQFAQRLQGRFKVTVALQDERLSTVAAKSTLFTQGGFRALQKKQVDAQSASIILEDWFNAQSHPPSNTL